MTLLPPGPSLVLEAGFVVRPCASQVTFLGVGAELEVGGDVCVCVVWIYLGLGFASVGRASAN
eukprot:SAG31_NODE_383_length_16451_cov_8.412977_9_plen_63_part_00